VCCAYGGGLGWRREGDEGMDGGGGMGWGWMRTDTQRNVYFFFQCMQVLLGRTVIGLVIFPSSP